MVAFDHSLTATPHKTESVNSRRHAAISRKKIPLL
jgi:hypothetical protein